MPGLSNLNDKDFLKAFQVTDAIIQNNQPVFLFIWIGSILAVLATILVSLVSIESYVRRKWDSVRVFCFLKSFCIDTAY